MIEKTGANGRVYTYNDLSGTKIGTLTVLYRGDDKPTKSRTSQRWMCECECGTIKLYDISNLRAGLLKIKEQGDKAVFSCGCKKRYLPKGESTCRGLYGTYGRAAIKRGYSYEISLEQFKSIVTKDCHYCGRTPFNFQNRKKHYGSFVYSGIDRVDNTKGYIINNLVPCCKTCNRAKDTMGADVFLNWIALVYNHSLNKPANTLINHSFGHISHQPIL